MTKSRKLICSIVAILAAAFPIAVSARNLPVKGEKSLGVTAGYASYNNSGYAGVYFQYTFAQHVRIAPEVSFVFRNEDKSALAINADMHFPFRVARGVTLYPLAGLAFNNWSYRGGGSSLKVGGDVGGGCDIYFTANFKFTVQARYSIMDRTSGLFAGAGFGYVF